MGFGVMEHVGARMTDFDMKGWWGSGVKSERKWDAEK